MTPGEGNSARANGEAAHDWSVPGGRIPVFGGGSYPEPALLSEEITIETILDNAVLGE
jgi:hypothetical protein